MVDMDDTALTDWIVESAGRLAEVAAIVGSREPVPTCPPWTMRQLVAHVISGLSGWYTHNLTHGDRPIDFEFSWNSQPPLPRGNAERLGYLIRVAGDFSDFVASRDLDAPCYVFQHRRTAQAWVLRAATETAVHVWDAEEVLGEVTKLPADRAATSIDETLRYMWPGALLVTKEDPRGEGLPEMPVGIRAVDLDHAWRVSRGADDLVVELVDPDETLPADSITGEANDIVRWLFGRIPTTSLAVTGDQGVIEAWNLSAAT